jgi:hypothetical protein
MLKCPAFYGHEKKEHECNARYGSSPPDWGDPAISLGGTYLLLNIWQSLHGLIGHNPRFYGGENRINSQIIEER